ncbi:NUDIX domain-containing protein [Romeria aff. gracilis LEGE 07310]|uniref:NUDIX domain-containing protein n=1 Tax=Vasconcelosia minhoensis LEGE 07310 TaxID=915328 RepID=A0A8J7A6I4_9CYAN|nr:NUDIX domain-containing protein [Romeria gracilis]MBE9076825.1 NUDIX domain-containing protein [Romeria aff. gracilis LEGE 07310]
MPNQLRVIAYAVVQEQRLLLVRKRQTTKFMFPGGKYELGESDLDCLQREVKEELGCRIDLSQVSFLGEFVTAAANEPDSQIVARVYTGPLLGEPVPTNEIEELFWLSRDAAESPSRIAPLVTECVIPALTRLNQL